VLAGDGPVFCAGGDLGSMSSAASAGDLPALLADAGARFAALIEAIVRCPRPVVAAVRGAAAGGGMSLALACDVRIADRTARLIPSWGRWGLPPDGGATALLALLIGPLASADVFVRRAEIGAGSPFAPAVFAEVVDDDVLDRAVAVAAALAASLGAAAAKAVTRGLVLPTLRAQIDVELAALQRAAADPAVVATLTTLAGR
jgi:2-(1,2-epoxy-1,2-dihydrophenyl)acetyl-CoA isomerase